jgi:catechol 2,3-dioxygenase-like lactoylglutathione lyase family enzyme
MVPTPCLVSIICADHVALAGFYAKVCGFSEITELQSPIFTALQTPSVALGFHAQAAFELLGIDDAGVPSGQMHLNFDVGGPDEVIASGESFLAAGATLVKAPFETYYGAFQTVVADPEGNVVRITTSQAALTMSVASVSDAVLEPDELLVNIGDLMADWTAGRWTSTLHRVVPSAPDRDRLTVTFFHHPNYDATISPLPAVGTEATASKGVSAGEYLAQKVEALALVGKN